ncbi:MAG: 1-acyl-sn-glycerol-3-phosphate acyltransferase [Spirochaetota bacterium]
MQQFLEDEFWAPLAWVGDFSLPVILKAGLNIERIVIEPADRKMLSQFKNERLIFFTNHPTIGEPIIAYHVANLMHSRFKYMTTRKVFDFYGGIVGDVIRKVGAFSIIPGIADRDSMRYARSVLAEKAGKLVLFPEGEPMCGENDNLMPLQAGVVKLGFSALEDIYKKEEAGDIMILPGFIKYVINSSQVEIEKSIYVSLNKIEKKLGLKPEGRNLLRRFLYIARILLEINEKEYGIEVSVNSDYDYRIGRVRHAILDSVAEKLQVQKYDTNADSIQKLRHLSMVIELHELGLEIPGLVKIPQSTLKVAARECIKASDFIVMKRDYLMEKPTPERFFEWLQRFEYMVLGRLPNALGGEPSHLPRDAHVRFAKPFYLSEYYHQFKENRRKGLKLLLDRIETDLKNLLEVVQPLARIMVSPNEIGPDAK